MKKYFLLSLFIFLGGALSVTAFNNCSNEIEVGITNITEDLYCDSDDYIFISEDDSEGQFLIDCNGHTLTCSGGSCNKIFEFSPEITANITIQNCNLIQLGSTYLSEINVAVPSINFYNNNVTCNFSTGSGNCLQFGVFSASSIVNLEHNTFYSQRAAIGGGRVINVANDNCLAEIRMTENNFYFSSPYTNPMFSSDAVCARDFTNHSQLGNYYNKYWAGGGQDNFLAFSCTDENDDGICENAWNYSSATYGYWFDYYPLLEPAPYSPPCTPAWECTSYGNCNISDFSPCNATMDMNNCGVPYTGDFSEFTPFACNYCLDAQFTTTRTITILGDGNCTYTYSNFIFAGCCAQTGLYADCIFIDPFRGNAIINFTGTAGQVNVTELCSGYIPTYDAADAAPAIIDGIAKIIIAIVAFAGLIGIAFVARWIMPRVK